MKYTEKIHAEGLLEIFSQEKPCSHCPSKIMRERLTIFSWDGEWWGDTIWDDTINHEPSPPQCKVCWDFIGGDRWAICPCRDGNETRAAKATWLALEEKGYL